jgi:crotonobetainyl-CoA:carnitine CoA-transferase CaiB-like acyl-CoA transferase
LSGFGSTGPYSHIPGHDINFQAISGLLGLTGTSDGQPAVSQVPLAGFAGGDMYAVIAILLALFYRERTGIGQYCDISMLDSAISYLSSGLAAWSGWGKLPPMGADSLTGGFAYYNIYRTADWRWLSLGAIELKFWTAFCERLERPQYIEWQFDPDRQEAIIADLRQIFAQKTMSEWLEHFADLDICLAPVLTLEETAEHPQVQARQMIFPAPHDSHAGNCMLAGSPIKMSVTPPEIKPIYARAGEHNEEILNSK